MDDKVKDTLSKGINKGAHDCRVCIIRWTEQKEQVEKERSPNLALRPKHRIKPENDA